MNGADGVAAVVGAGPGLGGAIARRFAGEGFAVALLARREESVAETRREIEGSGGTALFVATDATDAASVAAAFERVRAELGDPGVLVYNAGAFRWAVSWSSRPMSSTFVFGPTAPGGVSYTTRKRAHFSPRCHGTMSILPSLSRSGARRPAVVLGSRSS